MLPVMNNAKWKEIQEAMYGLQHKPQWRTQSLKNGYISNWDSEWFYHFSEGGFDDIEWVEIKTENGFKVFGYVREGELVDYL